MASKMSLKSLLRLLTTKASIMIGFAALMATDSLLIHFMPTEIAHLIHSAASQKDSITTVLFALMYCFVFISGGLGVCALFPREFVEGPDLSKAEKIYLKHSLEIANKWVADAYAFACERNERQLRLIAKIIFFGFTSLIMAVALRMVIQFIYLYS